jgi:integrator complex subunit 1
LRNIAVAHPALVLRHLNTLAALVEGRVQPSQKEFLEKHHRLYLNVLAILDALRPHVFHSRWLDRVLEACFSAISVVCGSYNKALSGFLAKFAEFLCGFAVAVPRMRALLTPPRQKLLAEVQQVYLEVKPLSTLLAVLAEQELGLWDLSHTTLGDGQGQPTGASISLTDTEVQATRAHLRIPPATASEEAGGREKLLDTLSDLEMASLRSPGILQLFLEDLLDLLDPRSMPSFHFAVLPLLLRFLHHAPRDAAAVMPRYLECLVSPVDDVLRESLKYAPEYFPFAQGRYAQDMLARLFELTLTRPLVGAAVPLKSILLSCFQLM